MTATTSASTKSFFGRRFLTDILENKKLLIINFVLELLGLPVVSVICLIFADVDKRRQNTSVTEFIDVYALLSPFLFIAVGTIIISILLGFVIALFHFDHLYRKPVVDMNYSLPLTNTQRFFADYLSGLTSYLVPVIISVILSFVILGTGSVFVDLSDVWPVIPYIFKSGLIVIVGMIMLYTISVFSIVFCGSTFEAIFSIIAVTSMIPATIGCVWLAIITTSSYGMVGESIFYTPAFTSTSPIGAAVFFFIYFFEGVNSAISGGVNSYYESMYLRWMICAVIMTAVYLIVAFLLYKKRKAESVSKPYVYKVFFYAIGTMAVFCIISLLISTGINIVSAAASGIVICGIGWFIMEVIARRGFKRFWTAPIGFCAAVLSVFIVCGICKVTDGFGAPRFVPSSLSVESVSIDVNDDTLLPYSVYEIRFRDRDVIKAVTALNKEAVDRHFNFSNYEYKGISGIDSNYDRYDSQNIEITYQTVYGSTVMREYNVMSSMLGDVISAVLCSDEYAQYTSESLAVTLVNNKSNSYFTSYEQAKRANRGGILNVHNKLDQEPISVSLNSSSLEELRKAYRQDMADMTPEQLAGSSIYCYLNKEYWVLDTFENTKAFLAERDIEVHPIEISDITSGGYSSGGEERYTTKNLRIVYMPRIYSTPRSFFGSNDNTRSYYYYREYYDGADESIYSESDTMTSAFPIDYDNSYYDSDLEAEVTVSPALIELINQATPIIINEKPIGILHYRDLTLYIRDTDSNRKLLKQYRFGA